MRALHLSPLPDPTKRPIEVVERKGLGHPDTICDAIAEQLSRSLCKFYRDRFGFILHHNVDKVLLWGGASKPLFGGGEVLAPLEIFLCGRATEAYKGVTVPVAELAMEGTKEWLRDHLKHLDPTRHVRVHSLVRPGSADLVDLFVRQQSSGSPLANDTSIGVGYAPFSSLEATVLNVERTLNSAEIKSRHPALGEDIKVMGLRRANDVDVTLSCAVVDRYVKGIDDYLDVTSKAAQIVAAVAERAGGRPATVTVNGADDIDRGVVYLTVTGTSAEAGDDGEAGRGNRVNGLITPHRPMTMESVAGKNPVTHVGKLYNVAARSIAESVIKEVPGISAAECYLVSQIGKPIREPQLAEVRVCDGEKRPISELEPMINAIVSDHLGRLNLAWRRFVEGDIALVF